MKIPVNLAKTTSLLLLLITQFCFSQNNWKKFEKEAVITKYISKSTKFQINDLTIHAKWNDKLSYSENIGHYGGIEKLTITANNRVLQVINNIEDNVALDQIIINFYDYNFDGYLDFSVQDQCGQSSFYKYYIYKKKQGKFKYAKDWDYIRVQQVNKVKKQILTQPDGMQDNRELFSAKNENLIKLKRTNFTNN